MAKLFLSYSRKDAVRATRFAEWLERDGHDVWRDDDDISGGASFSSAIEAALKDCDAVLVLWSISSHDSAWVRDEAAVGRDAGKLIPFSLDRSEPPIGFRQFQTIDLSRWGHGEPQKAAQIRQAIAKYSTDYPSPQTHARQTAGKSRLPLRSPVAMAVAALALLLIAGVSGYILLSGAHDTTTIAIAGGSGGGNDSELASRISADMAPVLAARAEDATIVAADGNDKHPDFRLSVAITPAEPGAGGRLSLSSPHEGGIIWSRNWNGAGLAPADLKQQMSFVASIAMLCALEGDKGHLGNRKGALGIYVQACTRDYDSDSTADELINLLTKTVERAPDFAPAWARLATIYSQQVGRLRARRETVPFDLLKKSQGAIENARKADPDSAQAFLAEGLAQANAALALPLIDRAVDMNPYDPVIRGFRADSLMSVGRQADAIMDIRKSVELIPPSPVVRAPLIDKLMRSGRSTEGLAELQKAEALWPNDIEISICRYSYELEYGDPRIAQKLLPSLAGARTGLDDQLITTLQELIKAKIDPRPETIDPVLARLMAAFKKQPRLGNLYIYALGLLNRTNESFELLSNPIFQSVAEPSSLFRPQYRPVRADPRFMKISADLGLVRYWRSSGKWPDFCTEPGLPYDCKVEAAKYH